MLTVGTQEKLFVKLLTKPQNNCCADCGSKSPTCTHVIYVGASIDFGVFVCLNCSGAHRALGPSITRVRSTKLDTWQSSWSDLLILGNQQCNKYWESNLTGSKKPTPNSSLEQIKKFVQDKYVKKRYASAAESDPITVLKGKIARGEDIIPESTNVIVKLTTIEPAAPSEEIKPSVKSILQFVEDDDHLFSAFQGAPSTTQSPSSNTYSQPKSAANEVDLLNFDDHHTVKQPTLNFENISHNYGQPVNNSINSSYQVIQHPSNSTQNMYGHSINHDYGQHHPHYAYQHINYAYNQQMMTPQPYLNMYGNGIHTASMYPQHHQQAFNGLDLRF